MTTISPVDRPPLPHNIELEQAMLGAVLVQNDAFHHVAGFLDPRHFYEPIHQKIYEIAATLIRAGKVATPISIRPFLPAELTIAGLAASVYLARLSGEATTVINASDYGRSIRDLAERRDLIAIFETAIATAMNAGPDETAQAIGNAAVEGLAEIVTADRMQGGTIRPIGLAMADFVEHVAAIYQGTAGDDVITTGLRDLDERTGGLARGSLVVLAGRPGMGKTTVAAAIGRNAARQGHGTAFFSLEMPSRQIMARMLADTMFDAGDRLTIDNRLSVHRIAKAKFSPEEFDSIVDVARAMERWPFSIDDTPHATAGSILAKCQATKKQLERAGQRLDLVIVDYLKFVHASDRYAGQRHYEVGEITASLKQLARRLGCVVLLCAQLNRDVEKRNDRRPQLSDLRESGDIEADADIVLLLFREAYYLQRDPEIEKDAAKMRRLEEVQHLVEFIVAKNRTGPTDTIPTFINLEFSAVRDRARQGDLDFARTR
jgi:replicative DNA helicase